MSRSMITLYVEVEHADSEKAAEMLVNDVKGWSFVRDIQYDHEPLDWPPEGTPLEIVGPAVPKRMKVDVSCPRCGEQCPPTLRGAKRWRWLGRHIHEKHSTDEARRT